MAIQQMGHSVECMGCARAMPVDIDQHGPQYAPEFVVSPVCGAVAFAGGYLCGTCDTFTRQALAKRRKETTTGEVVAPPLGAAVLGMLTELDAGWVVSISNGDERGEWRVEIRNRDQARHKRGMTFWYAGPDLRVLIQAAWAGEPSGGRP